MVLHFRNYIIRIVYNICGKLWDSVKKYHFNYIRINSNNNCGGLFKCAVMSFYDYCDEDEEEKEKE